MKITEFFSLFWLNLVVKGKNFIEFVKIVRRYYWCLPFFKADLTLCLMYLFKGPYAISKRYLTAKGEKDLYAYGETPLTTLEEIAKQSMIGPEDCVFELGAGRGRGCFWLSSLVGCTVVGIEYVPEFVSKANRIKKILGFEKIEFRLEDFSNINLHGATVCYLYGTCLEDEAIRALIKKFAKLPPGTRIVTVSYPLSDYVDNNESTVFEVIKHFTSHYPWGQADIYVQILKKNAV